MLIALVSACAATPADAHEPAEGPEEVKVGALINDIQQLDLQTHSYAVDTLTASYFVAAAATLIITLA